MIYTKHAPGVKIRFVRVATAKDAALDNREPDDHDHVRAEAGYLMVGRFVNKNGLESEERLFDLALLRADDGWNEIKKAAKEVGNKKLK